MLTSYDDDEALFAAVMAGASGYLLKEIVGSTLLEDIRQVARGSVPAGPRRDAEAGRAASSAGAERTRAQGLDPARAGVIDLIADGYTNRQIGERLFLAEKTIKNYVSSILMKLGMERRTQAAVFGSTARLRAAHGFDQSPTHDRDPTPRHQGG